MNSHENKIIMVLHYFLGSGKFCSHALFAGRLVRVIRSFSLFVNPAGPNMQTPSPLQRSSLLGGVQSYEGNPRVQLLLER